MDIKESDLVAPFILDRAKYLGQSYITPQTKHNKLLRTEPSKNIELNNFKSYMEDHPPPTLSENDLDTALSRGLKVINEGAKFAKKDDTVSRLNTWDRSQPVPLRFDRWSLRPTEFLLLKRRTVLRSV